MPWSAPHLAAEVASPMSCRRCPAVPANDPDSGVRVGCERNFGVRKGCELGVAERPCGQHAALGADHREWLRNAIGRPCGAALGNPGDVPSRLGDHRRGTRDHHRHSVDDGLRRAARGDLRCSGCENSDHPVATSRVRLAARRARDLRVVRERRTVTEVLRIRLLGTLCIEGDDGTQAVAAIGPARARQLLAILAVAQAKLVPRQSWCPGMPSSTRCGPAFPRRTRHGRSRRWPVASAGVSARSGVACDPRRRDFGSNATRTSPRSSDASAGVSRPPPSPCWGSSSPVKGPPPGSTPAGGTSPAVASMS